jgi:hypothetical protein
VTADAISAVATVFAGLWEFKPEEPAATYAAAEDVRTAIAGTLAHLMHRIAGIR